MHVLPPISICPTVLDRQQSWTKKKNKHYFLTFRCRKQIKSYNGITGLHCRWCHLTLHNRCASHVSPECTLGVNGVHVLPPISICPTVLDRQHSVAKEKHSQRSKKDKNCQEESSQVFRVFNENLVFCYQNCSDLQWEKVVLVIKIKFFEIRGWKSRICKIFEVWLTIHSNSERSEQFLVTECFF